MFLNPLSYLENPLTLIPIALIAICVIHAVRRGNVFPWIYIIIFLPGIGSLIYFAVEIVPELFRSRNAGRVKSGAQSALDPNRSFREAHRAAEMVGSVDSKRALAEQYAARQDYKSAIEIYRDAAQGQFKDDPALLMGLARAQFNSADAAGAQSTLDALQAADPNIVSQEGHLLYARALEAQGKNEEAIGEYRRLVPYFSGEEAKARFGLLLEKTGAHSEARSYFQEIVKSLEGAPARYRKAQKEWGTIATRALG